jgi:ATP-dependent RNA helicase DDX52/ROK1
MRRLATARVVRKKPQDSYALQLYRIEQSHADKERKAKLVAPPVAPAPKVEPKPVRRRQALSVFQKARIAQTMETYSPTEFSALGVWSPLEARLKRLGMLTATQVQYKMIPELLEELGHMGSKPMAFNPTAALRRTYFVQSPTGSGKTLSYLVPVIDNLLRKAFAERLAAGVHTLILAPTRELCIQINSHVAKFLDKPPGFQGALGPKYLFLDDFRSTEELHEAFTDTNPSLVIVTPKTLLRYFSVDNASGFRRLVRSTMTDIHGSFEVPREFQRISCVIMDECDSILSPLNKYAPLKKVLVRMRHPKSGEELLNVLLRFSDPLLIAVSATMNSQFRHLLHRRGWCVDSRVVVCKHGEHYTSVPRQIKHRAVGLWEDTPEFVGASLWHTFRNVDGSIPTLVVVPSSYSLVNLASQLQTYEIKCFLLHETFKSSRPSQSSSPSNEVDRPNLFSRISAEFESGHIEMMITTYETVRGIDFSWLRSVYLIHPPKTKASVYIHCAGRTGRNGLEGTVTSFVLKNQKVSFMNMLKSKLGVSVQEIPLPRLF